MKAAPGNTAAVHSPPSKVPQVVDKAVSCPTTNYQHLSSWSLASTNYPNYLHSFKTYLSIENKTVNQSQHRLHCNPDEENIRYSKKLQKTAIQTYFLQKRDV